MIKSILKLCFCLLVAFGLVTLVSPQVFLANTPRINPLFIASIKNLPTNIAGTPDRIVAYIGNIITNKNNQTNPSSTVIIPASVALKEVTSGVYAGEDAATKKTYIRIDKTNPNLKQKEYTIQGIKVVVYGVE